LEKGEKILQQATDEMEYTYNIFQRGALPLGILKTAARLSQPAIDRLRESWASLYGGAKNSAKTVILEEGMEYSPLSMKPTDLQLNESKSGTNSEICKLFGVPESMITTAANKYGSIEQNNLHFLKHCLAPIIGSFESSADKSLLLETEKQEGYFFRFDTSELLRATEKERVEAVELGLRSGLFTINEARGKLDLPNIDEDVFMWGLQSVLYNPKTGEMKVPNMGLTGGEATNESTQSSPAKPKSAVPTPKE
jgi:HK97 family phage portal protein